MYLGSIWYPNLLHLNKLNPNFTFGLSLVLLVQVRPTEVVSRVCAPIELDLLIGRVGNINPNIETSAGLYPIGGLQCKNRKSQIWWDSAWAGGLNIMHIAYMVNLNLTCLLCAIKKCQSWPWGLNYQAGPSSGWPVRPGIATSIICQHNLPHQ